MSAPRQPQAANRHADPGVWADYHPAFGGIPNVVSESAPRPLRIGTLQRKLAVSEVGDEFEKEADEFAAQVMRMPEPTPTSLARACACGGGCPSCQMKDELLQPRREAGGAPGRAAAPSSVHNVIAAAGAPLETSVRAFMEPRFNRDFGHVRVHLDRTAQDSAREVGARAYTVGPNVVFGEGQYDPSTRAGQELIAHELTHVLQQGDRVVRRKPLTAEEKAEDLESDRLMDDARLQKAFDNAPVLKKNETSEGVKTLQRALRDLDYPLPISFEKTGDADGIFGDETREQVKQFQRDNNITDDGVVERETLRILDSKFNPKVTIDRVYIGDDRRDLVDNTADWSASGSKYVDWANVPYHIKFSPGHVFNADAIPVTLPANKTLQAIARVVVRGGIPGHKYKITSEPTDAIPGWKFSGEETHKNGPQTEDIVFLTGEAPTPKKISFQDTSLLWDTETDLGKEGFGMSRMQAFITSGAAFNTGQADAGDFPNVPTFKRMRQAVRMASGVDVGQADRIVYRVFKRFPNYGVCDVPDTGNNYGFSCPHLSSVWEMSDFINTGNFQCITISRYANAVLNVLGVPHAVERILVKPVVIWATPETKETGIDSDWPHPGIHIPSRVHPKHPNWPLGLIDGNCGINNYEACVKLQWTPTGQTDTITQYYCGGLGEANPREGFKTPREVLNSAFVLAYYVQMPNNDPNTGFPRGIRKEDVKIYNESGSCHVNLP